MNEDIERVYHSMWHILSAQQILTLTAIRFKKKKRQGGGFKKEAGSNISYSSQDRRQREGNVNPFQYSCRENSMDRGAWRTTVRFKTEATQNAQPALQEQEKQKTKAGGTKEKPQKRWEGTEGAQV